jgi:ribosomal protein L10
MSKSKLQKHIIAHKISAMLKDSRVILIFHYNNVQTKSWNQLKKELFKLRATCLSTARCAQARPANKVKDL